MGLISYVKNSDGRRSLKKLDKMALKVEALEGKYQKMSDAELQSQTGILKERLKNGETLDDILYDAFAALREASWRVLGMKHFHVQIVGGICLFQGRIAEMKTGEGKTLVATLPSYLEALGGKGVHIVTVNDYLARRDAEWMGKVHKFMGLKVGVVVPGMDDDEKRAAYQADITYGTNNEFGFDYLRDNLKYNLNQMVQRELNFAIVDEVDSILIDEARTPLIISQREGKSSDLYQRADTFVRTLKGGFDDEIEEEEKKSRREKGPSESKLRKAEEREWDFIIERKEKQVHLTESGASKAEEFFGISDWDGIEEARINHHIQQALKAHHLFKLGEEYIIKDGEIIIVDEFTGRLMIGRRYSDGLHQAIEAKEGVKVLEENKTAATITFQNYFRLYKKLSGMTGTAKTEEGEFRTIYSLDVVEIPTNRPVARKDWHDRIFSTYEGKKRAIVREIVARHEKGQPVLVGTVSVEKSEELSRLLRVNGIKHNILNAVNHEREAEIVAQAGGYGVVTIATNMAGRGTDILLGGNPEYLAREQMRKELAVDRYRAIKEGKKLTEEEETAQKKSADEEISAMIELATGFADTDDEETIALRARYRKLYNSFKEKTDEEKKKVIEAGGLLIIGTERHESRRIDNQLRGRSGRQGDVGESIFFISLEDDLMKRFGGERMKVIYERSKMQEDESLESGTLTRLIEYAQKQIEGRNFGIRKNVLQYDDVMNTMRMIIYSERMKVLRGEDVHDQVKKYISDFIAEYVIRQTVDFSAVPEKWNEEDLNKALERGFLPAGTGYVTRERLEKWDNEIAVKKIAKKVEEAYENKIAALKEEDPELNFGELERRILLLNVTGEWVDHIDAMDQLRKSIGLRSYAQIDPVIEYKKEGFAMFDEMVERIQNHTIEFLLRVNDETARRVMRLPPRFRGATPTAERILPQAGAAPVGYNLGTVPVAPVTVGVGGQAPAPVQTRQAPAPMQAQQAAGVREEIDASKLRNVGTDKPVNATVRKAKKPGPNDPCYCGSGLKYKKCHMLIDEANERK